MGRIQYVMKNGTFMIADTCCVTEDDGIDELDCSVRVYRLLMRNGYGRIGQVTAESGITFFMMDGIGMRGLKELFEHLDFLGFWLADWPREQSVEEYYSVYKAANDRLWAEIREQMDKEDRKCRISR